MELYSNLVPFELSQFDIQTLKIKSRKLENNPLGDPAVRLNPVLMPKKIASESPKPVIFVLSGFSSNGTKSFNFKGYEDNTAQSIDRAVEQGEAPVAYYVFVDAWTWFGGSQFINSTGTGNYEDYLVEELVPTVASQLAPALSPRYWCVAGGSSGGYGALHLSSKYPDIFGVAAAIAPDSFFEASLLPDIYSALPVLYDMGGLKGLKEAMQAGTFFNKKSAFPVLNAVGMGLCYAPGREPFSVDFPVDSQTGVLDTEVWGRWKEKDPVNFLRKRAQNCNKLAAVYLDVGRRDEFQLQFGTRQIRRLLEDAGIKPHYQEFDGGHFDLGARRPWLWQWLKQQWGE